ncbi:hypothetical protein F5879DRAFT_493835 [Lentinula edodes]|nr:hypothetical protein F5879DRAFT_493835 [Lentinula edodes]
MTLLSILPSGVVTVLRETCSGTTRNSAEYTINVRKGGSHFICVRISCTQVENHTYYRLWLVTSHFNSRRVQTNADLVLENPWSTKDKVIVRDICNIEVMICIYSCVLQVYGRSTMDFGTRSLDSKIHKITQRTTVDQCSYRATINLNNYDNWPRDDPTNIFDNTGITLKTWIPK